MRHCHDSHYNQPTCVRINQDNTKQVYYASLHLLFLNQESSHHFYRYSSCSFHRFICVLQLNTQIHTYVNAPDTTLTRFICQWGSSCRPTFGKQISVVKEINRLLYWFQWINFEQSISIKHPNESTNIYVYRFILMNHACSMQWHVHDRNKQRKKVSEWTHYSIIPVNRRKWPTTNEFNITLWMLLLFSRTWSASLWI
jgi:hypothetical protein